jgi:phosphoglycerate kinase
MQSIHTYDFSGKRALIRVDFDVPVDENSAITDDSRIRQALPTINKVLHGGGSAVIMSHFGPRQEGFVDKFSMRYLAGHLGELLHREVKPAPDCIYDETKAMCMALKSGEVILLENLSFHRCEQNCVVEFAEELAKNGDCFINDAFCTADSVLASTTVISRFFPNDKMFGFLVERELENLRDDTGPSRMNIIQNLLGTDEN